MSALLAGGLCGRRRALGAAWQSPEPVATCRERQALAG
jgi:hypothetical protein